MAKKEQTGKNLQKLTRLELVEMIYALRKENVTLLERCAQMQGRMEDYEELRSQMLENDERMERLEEMTEALYDLCINNGIPVNHNIVSFAKTRGENATYGQARDDRPAGQTEAQSPGNAAEHTRPHHELSHGLHAIRHIRGREQ